jgi:hypothetical protein
VVANSLATAILTWVHIYGPDTGAGYLFAFGLLGLAAVVAAWFAPRPVVAALATAAAGLAAYVSWGGNRAMAILPVGLLVTLSVLVFLGERMPRSWLWLAGALFAANVILPLTPLGFLFLYTPLLLVPWIIVGAVVLWAFVDARPVMALAIYLACAYPVFDLLSYLGYGGPIAGALSWPMLGYAIVAVVLASGSFWRLRRQAAL